MRIMKEPLETTKIRLTLDNIKELSIKRGSPVHKQRIHGKNSVPTYRLLKPLYFELSNGEHLTIPGGFIWDLSSVPRIFWTLFAPDGDFEIASIIHDFLYQNKLYTRAFADTEMYLWSVVLSGTKNKISFRNFDNWTRYKVVQKFGGKKHGEW